MDNNLTAEQIQVLHYAIDEPITSWRTGKNGILQYEHPGGKFVVTAEFDPESTTDLVFYVIHR